MLAPPIPPAGVWVPAVTFFDPHTDQLDLDAQAAYFRHLSTTGLSGLVVLGTNAETFLLTREERRELVRVAREAVGPHFPLMAGISGHSTRQVIEFAVDACAAGADYGLVLPPGYFGAAQSTPAVVEAFYHAVAEASPLPLVLYNFPAVTGGVDLDSATVARLAKAWPGNIVGVKLTCGSVAKIVRLAAELSAGMFAIFGGQSDFLVGGLAAGSAGCIAAFGNVFPKAIVETYRLWVAGRQQEALELQRMIALAEQLCKGGVGTVKYAAAVWNAGPVAGIEGAVEKLAPRRPYLPPAEEVRRRIREEMGELAEIENTL